MNILPLIALSLLGLLLSSCSTLPRTAPQPSLKANEWTSFDGKTMPSKLWPVPAGKKERAVIIAVHGLSGAASDFWLLGERMPAQGVTVYAYELRGQGNDPDKGKRGDVASAELWLHDLQTFHQLVRAKHPGKPIIWYGESLGSLIALHSASKCKPDAIVLASPVAGLKMHLSEAERLCLRAASRTLPRFRVKLGELAGVDESKIRVTSTSTHGGKWPSLHTM